MLVKDREKFGFGRRVRREIFYASLIGSAPMVVCSTASELSEMVKTLLTAPVLMGYYTVILGIFTLVSILILKARFRSPSYNHMMRQIHVFLQNIGGSLLMAFRAALGAMIGFLLMWGYQDPGTINLPGVFTTASYAMMTLSVCIMLAWMDEALRAPHAMTRYR